MCDVQELKSMIADDAVFKADGVVYTSDTKGEGCSCSDAMCVY